MDTLTNTSSLFDFSERYVQRGFGSMTKNDFEVFIFRQLLLNPKYQNKSNYELSIALRITETKIKRLRYEVALRFPEEREDKREKVKKILEHAQLRTKEKKIEFLVEDVSLQKYIANILKKNGRFSDSSFNSELMLIHFEDFYYLLENVYSQEEFESATQQVQQLLQSLESLEQKIDSSANQQEQQLLLSWKSLKQQIDSSANQQEQQLLQFAKSLEQQKIDNIKKRAVWEKVLVCITEGVTRGLVASSNFTLSSIITLFMEIVKKLNNKQLN